MLKLANLIKNFQIFNKFMKKLPRYITKNVTNLRKHDKKPLFVIVRKLENRKIRFRYSDGHNIKI